MKVSGSILSNTLTQKEALSIYEKTSLDYIHLDIMDGVFVENTTWTSDELRGVLINNIKPLDVHLMVRNVKSYVDSFARLNPEYITFHYEAIDDIDEMINYIKSLGIKVGISIKPNTKIEEIYRFLPKVDLVLVMSVNPGMGGQEFILGTQIKVNGLKEYKLNNNLDYLISVDGGINGDTIKLIRSADIAVSGSFIIKNNYEEAINTLRG